MDNKDDDAQASELKENEEQFFNKARSISYISNFFLVFYFFFVAFLFSRMLNLHTCKENNSQLKAEQGE
jgi:hypothetical protein